MKLGSHKNDASSSCFTIPFDKTSPNALRKTFSPHRSSAARPGVDALMAPRAVMWGWVKRKKKRSLARSDREANFTSFQILGSTFRKRATSVLPFSVIFQEDLPGADHHCAPPSPINGFIASSMRVLAILNDRRKSSLAFNPVVCATRSTSRRSAGLSRIITKELRL